MKFVFPGSERYQAALAKIFEEMTSADKGKAETYGSLEMRPWYGESAVLIQATHAGDDPLNHGSPLISFESNDPGRQAKHIAGIFAAEARIVAEVIPGVGQAKGKMFIVETLNYPYLRFACTLPKEQMPKPDTPKSESEPKSVAKITASRRKE